MQICRASYSITTGASFRSCRRRETSACSTKTEEALKFVNGLLERLRERARETRKPAVARPRDELTARERSIVEFIARGRSNKEIARELGVAPETIKTHLKRIFQKLSAELRTQAVVRAQSLGMLKISPSSGRFVGRRELGARTDFGASAPLLSPAWTLHPIGERVKRGHVPQTQAVARSLDQSAPLELDECAVRSSSSAAAGRQLPAPPGILDEIWRAALLNIGACRCREECRDALDRAAVALRVAAPLGESRTRAQSPRRVWSWPSRHFGLLRQPRRGSGIPPTFQATLGH